MSESDDMFTEIQDVGMPDIGTAVEFELDGKPYNGIVDNPSASTVMLTGGYQGRAELVILATRDQFASPPGQRGEIVITSPKVFNASQWQRKQVEPYGAVHFAITVMKQLPSQ